MREKFVRLQQMSTLLNLDNVGTEYDYCCLCGLQYTKYIGGRCGRILQWFRYCVEAERTGGTYDSRVESVNILACATFEFYRQSSVQVQYIYA